MNRLSYPRNTTDEDENKNENETQIIVKFTRWYCIELDAFCFESGCVPKILGYQELPGGWVAIVNCQPRQSALQRTRINTGLSRRRWHGGS